MADKKVYSIVINGVQESVNAIESLNKQLSELENRIKTLEKSSVKINASSSGGGSTSSGSKSSLNEEEKLAKQIEQIDAKRVAYSKEIYQNYLAAKDVLSETVNDQKQISAQERLQANNYTNTMAGLKQELKDLKSVMNGTDLNDDSFKQMSQRAGEITEKLKKLEESYGQFGRNVGNYANGVVEGLNKYKVQVGETTREFNSAREAAKTLTNELLNLPKGAKGAEELRAALQQVKSEIQDLGKSSATMDNLLDTMEGFMAVANAGQGIRALFGVDDAEIQKSIKNLVALQNVLKGIETINKQINTREGIGKWIAPVTTQVDKATTKLLTFNTALLGTGKAAKVAATGIKVFSKALKVAFSAGILIVVDLLVDKLMDLVESLGKVDDATERSKKIQEEAGKAYAEASAKVLQYQNRIKNFNGSRKEEKKLVEDLNKDLGSTLGTYKSLAEWKEVLKKKTDAYIQSMILEAQQQAILNQLIDVYTQKWNATRHMHDDFSFGEQVQEFFMGAKSVYDDRRKQISEFEQQAKQLEEQLKKNAEALEKFNQKNGIGNYAPQIEKNTDKSKKALEDEQKTLNELQLRLMKDGLNKKLMQLDEEERQTINKLKENGRKSADTIQKVERTYAQLRAKEIQEYLKTLEESVRKTARELANIQFTLDLKDIDNEIERLQNKFEELGNKVPKNKSLTSSFDFNNILGNTSKMDYLAAKKYSSNKAEASTGQYDNYYRDLYNYISKKNEEIRKKFNEIYDLTSGSDADKEKAQYGFAAKLFEEEYKDALKIVRDYGSMITDYFEVVSNDQTKILENGFEERLNASKRYYKESITQLVENLKKQSELREQAIKKQAQKEYDAERDRYRNQYNSLSGQASSLESDISGFSPKNSDDEAKLRKMKESLDEIYAQMETAAKQHSTKMAQINDAETNAIEKNTLDTYSNISSLEEKYFDTRLSDYRDFQSKLNDEISRNPITDKAGFGIVNIAQTRKNYKEILNASKTTLKGIQDDKNTLDKLYNGGFIKEEAYNATLKQLNELEQEIKNGMGVTAQASKNLVGDFIQSINQYVQAAGQALQDVMSAIWEYQDYQLEKEQEALDKLNDELEKKLDEQQDIVQKHKDAIDSIEDELATARGSRREHLIDQLNAEMEAQRAARKQEQKIQKDKEKAEKKQEELDKKRRKEEYDRNVMQAFISWHLAIMNGLATQPFLYMGVAMGALATALGAVQYALIKSQKPYARGGQLDGGVAQGNRHRDGGIPVLGGRASIEGGEYITNRVTTSKNVELLDYINSKKKKIDITDLMDFYSTTPRKTIKGVRTKFEDGGYLPTLPNELDIKDQLQNIVVNQDNRPIYVSVVDINNKQEDVRRVQTLAGL